MVRGDSNVNAAETNRDYIDIQSREMLHGRNSDAKKRASMSRLDDEEHSKIVREAKAMISAKPSVDDRAEWHQDNQEKIAHRAGNPQASGKDELSRAHEALPPYNPYKDPMRDVTLSIDNNIPHLVKRERGEIDRKGLVTSIAVSSSIYQDSTPSKEKINEMLGIIALTKITARNRENAVLA